MNTPSTPEAKSISAGVSYVPFGIPGLDGTVRGIPTGSTVLLAGAADAGGDAFAYTSLATLMLAKHDPDLVPAGISRRRDVIPDSVTYITLSNDRDHVYSETVSVSSDVIRETGVENRETERVSSASLQIVEQRTIPVRNRAVSRCEVSTSERARHC